MLVCSIQPPPAHSPSALVRFPDSLVEVNQDYTSKIGLGKLTTILSLSQQCNSMQPCRPHNEMAKPHFNALRLSLSPQCNPSSLWVGGTFFTRQVILLPPLVMDVGSESIRVVENCSDKVGDQVFFSKKLPPPPFCRGRVARRVLLIISIGDLDRLLI